MRRTAASLILAGATLLAGCRAAAPTIHGTDVPEIDALSVESSRDVVLIGDRLMLGSVSFRGASDDALATLRATLRRFEDEGWAVQWTTGDPVRSEAALVKDTRRATILVQRVDAVSIEATGVVAIEQLPDEG